MPPIHFTPHLFFFLFFTSAIEISNFGLSMIHSLQIFSLVLMLIIFSYLHWICEIIWRFNHIFTLFTKKIVIIFSLWLEQNVPFWIYITPAKSCGCFQMEPGKFDPRHSGELLKYNSLLLVLFTIWISCCCCCFFSLNWFWIDSISMFLVNRHMDKQNEVLIEAHRSMLHQLQKLQVVIFCLNYSILY